MKGPAVAGNSLVRRTQRAVREQSITAAEAKRRQRRGIGIAVLVTSLVLLALTPAVWIGFGWSSELGSIVDADSQSIYILLCLLPVAFMLGIIGWLWRRRGGDEQQL